VVPGSAGNLPFVTGTWLLSGSAVYGENRPVPALPGRNTNGENAAPVQPIDATHALNRSAGVSNSNVLRGLSFS